MSSCGAFARKSSLRDVSLGALACSAPLEAQWVRMFFGVCRNGLPIWRGQADLTSSLRRIFLTLLGQIAAELRWERQAMETQDLVDEYGLPDFPNV